MPTKDCQNGGIVFGDWKLFPVDDRNWELCHRHRTPTNAKSSRAGTAGKVRWHRTGRFYQYNTFPLALRYAADVELKAEAHGRVMELEDAIGQLELTLHEFAQNMQGALDGVTVMDV